MIKKLIGGHRGSPKKAKENTLESFSAAISDGADFIEFDIRYSKDKKLIIHHDPALHDDTAGALTGSVTVCPSMKLTPFVVNIEPPPGKLTVTM